jgi:hypothetical protein
MIHEQLQSAATNMSAEQHYHSYKNARELVLALGHKEQIAPANPGPDPNPFDDIEEELQQMAKAKSNRPVVRATNYSTSNVVDDLAMQGSNAGPVIRRPSLTTKQYSEQEVNERLIRMQREFDARMKREIEAVKASTEARLKVLTCTLLDLHIVLYCV